MNHRIFLLCVFSMCLSGFTPKLQAQSADTASVQSSAQPDRSQQALLLNTKGYNLLFGGKLSQARHYFLKAIDKDSLNRRAYYNLLEVCRTLNDYQTLATYFEQAKKVFPDDHEIFYLSGNIYQNLKQYEQAISDYNHAIEVASNTNQVVALAYAYYFNRGNSYLKLRKYPQAINDYTMTLELNPNNYGAYANRGMAKYNSKDRSGACQDWVKAQELGYEHVTNYLDKFCK